MQKKGIIISAVAVTAIATAVRIWTTLYYIDPLNGKFQSVVWQIISIVSVALCILLALYALLKRYTDFYADLPQSKLFMRIFSILAAMACLGTAVGCFSQAIKFPNGNFTASIAVTGVLAAAFFIYIAIAANSIKEKPLIYLSVGPFLFFILRIIDVFNIFSRNISLTAYKYEIVGLCCLVMLFLMFIKAALYKTSAKTAFFFAIAAFSFLIIYSVSAVFLSFTSENYFTNNAPAYYVYTDGIFGICSLYFGSLILPKSTTKH